MATVASFSSSKITAKLDADTAPDYAGNPLDSAALRAL